MKTSSFFDRSQSMDLKVKHQVIKSTDIKFILSHPKPGSLVILDIDDTIARVPQTIGLDAWFRFRIQQYANEGHADSLALSKTIEIYNQVQLASTHMITVDRSNDIAGLIDELKGKGIKVIALTARNHLLTSQTLHLLSGLGVHFSDDVVKPGSLSINDKPVEIKNGVIFSNGNNKGHCLEHALAHGYFVTDLHSYNSVCFVDDSERNCDAVVDSLTKLNIADCAVWHYNYAETYLPFEAPHQSRAAVQEAHLLTHQRLLTDDEADQHSMRVGK